MVNEFFRRVRLLPSDEQFGSVLVWNKNIIVAGSEIDILSNLRRKDKRIYIKNF